MPNAIKWFTGKGRYICRSDEQTLLWHRQYKLPCAHICVELQESSISCQSWYFEEEFSVSSYYESYVQ